MKYLSIFLLILSCASCGNETKNTQESALTASEAKPKTQQKTKQKAAIELPNLADYQGECPKLWGIVEGAAKSHVEKFIQNYIFVPENPGPMYSDINTFPYANGSTLIKAATYNMADDIVDQEMVTIFAGEKMTQCNVRFRCASDVKTWVNSCD